MGYVKCNICGGNMIAKEGKNSVYKNDILQHRICPQKKIGAENTELYKKIKDSIVEALIQYGSPEAKSRGLNWMFINSQINGLISRGFSYDDILYSFEMCIQRDKVFWGFGRVNKFIEQDKIQKQKYDEVKNIVPIENKKIKFNLKGGDYEW